MRASHAFDLPGRRATPRQWTKPIRSCAIPAIVLFLFWLAAAPAVAWSDRLHALIAEEAVQRLPSPLRDLFSGAADLDRLRQAAIAPDGWRNPESPHYRPDERPNHFFNIDGITSAPYPFADFPRRRADAVKKFGADAFKEHGTAPWAAYDALDALAGALADGRTDDVFEKAGQLAHTTADLHMPFHITKNYDGQLSGNPGIHKALEIGLVHRSFDFYSSEIRTQRRQVPYLADAQGRLFDWLTETYARIGPILEADAAARLATAYNPADHPEDLEDLASDRARPYYAAFKKDLEARGSPEAAAIRDAADHLAALLYSAWVTAGKPLSLAPAPPPPQPSPTGSYWWLLLPVALLPILFWPRRRPNLKS